MKIAIMQPYLFPYIGYFELINYVDVFVFLDDVSYANRPWINKNYILSSGRIVSIRIPMASSSQSTKISELKSARTKRWEKKLTLTIDQAYSKAMNYKDVTQIIEKSLFSSECYISEISKKSVIESLNYIGLNKVIRMTSCQYNNETLPRQERILDICRQEGAGTYVNLPGGQNLYQTEFFLNSGVELEFFQPSLTPYMQFGKEFVPGLSVLDAMMHVGRNQIKEIL
jgi:hypothetical protein